MKFFADENIDRQIVDRLRQDGHQVLSAAEVEPSISDDQVLTRDNLENSILLTADKDLVKSYFAKVEPHSG